MVRPFETDNPWWIRLFQDDDFGYLPSKAITALQAVTPDPSEKLFSAIAATSGIGHDGLLMATTELARWVEFGPLGKIRNQDYWDYSTGIEVQSSSVLALADRQFHLTRKGARAFARHYRLIQQALMWFDSHSTQDAGLERLASLFAKGLLTESEFSIAKSRLLSP